MMIMNKQNIISKFFTHICKFEMILNNNCIYNTFDVGNGKFFYVYKNGNIKYGIEPNNSKNYTSYYSVKKMEEILRRNNYEIL